MTYAFDLLPCTYCNINLLLKSICDRQPLIHTDVLIIHLVFLIASYLFQQAIHASDAVPFAVQPAHYGEFVPQFV